MPLQLVIAEAAKTDLTVIWVYIAQDDFEAADSVVDAVFEAAVRLPEWPEIGRERPELMPGVRSFPVGRLLVFYRVKETVLEVIRVIDGRRDLDAIF